MNCPLCQATDYHLYHVDPPREFYQCYICNLIFVPAEFHPSPAEEKARYDEHQNDSADQKYQQFLKRLFQPVSKLLSPGSQGLDFGSGPEPVLSQLFEAAGFSIHIYDPYYANDPQVFRQQYDFITASEVVEHLGNVRFELDRLYNCLKPGGILGIMTKLAGSPEEFEFWYYKRDKTHLCFFSINSFQWLADQWNAEVNFISDDVIIITKQN